MRTTGPGQAALLLLDVVDILNEMQIPYAVIGAFAVSYHGTPRATNDADAAIWLRESGRSQSELENCLTKARHLFRVRTGDVDDPIAALITIEDAHHNRMDLLLGIRGLAQDAITRTQTTSLYESPLNIISAEDLIAMKLFAGGVQDMEDVRGVIEVSRNNIDFALTKTLCKKYGTECERRLNELLDGRSD